MRSFTFDCPHCHSSLDVPEQLAGQEVLCSYCRKKLTIPKAEKLANQTDSKSVDKDKQQN